jgi:hypothetical protein
VSTSRGLNPHGVDMDRSAQRTAIVLNSLCRCPMVPTALGGDARPGSGVRIARLRQFTRPVVFMLQRIRRLSGGHRSHYVQRRRHRGLPQLHQRRLSAALPETASTGTGHISLTDSRPDPAGDCGLLIPHIRHVRHAVGSSNTPPLAMFEYKPMM